MHIHLGVICVIWTSVVCNLVPAGTTLVTPAVKFLVWENTIRKELQPLELTSKLTTQFAYNDTSRVLHKERYFRIDNLTL